MATRRDVAKERTKERVGKSAAVSSHRALLYHLISPYTIRRLAERKTVGKAKYGSVQWRIGINDVDYVADRFNHLWEHLLDFTENGNERDDNLGAMLWAINALIEVERLAPSVLNQVLGTSRLYGESAQRAHDIERSRQASSKTARKG